MAFISPQRVAQLPEAPLNIVLVEPEIPQNTGNIARTCACVGARLHLIEPLGFRPSERNLKRAGLDYWDSVEIVMWRCVEEFLQAHQGNSMYFFTSHTTQLYTDVSYSAGDYLLFGRESAGISPDILAAYERACVRLPMRHSLRSLNLSNAVAIATFHALHELGFPNLE